MDNSWNETEREDIFRAELTKLFLSKNRASSEALINSKAILLLESLKGLDTEHISGFFKSVRDSDDMLPTDGRLLALLRLSADKFGVKLKALNAPQATFTSNDKEFLMKMGLKWPNYAVEMNELLQDDEVYPSKDWIERFWGKMKHTPPRLNPDWEKKKAELGLSEGNDRWMPR